MAALFLIAGKKWNNEKKKNTSTKATDLISKINLREKLGKKEKEALGAFSFQNV